MNKSFAVLAIVSMVSLSACGDSTLDRSISGAGIGAGIGTVGGLVAGGALWPGVLVGAGVGVATGILTDTSQINLGTPTWKK